MFKFVPRLPLLSAATIPEQRDGAIFNGFRDALGLRYEARARDRLPVGDRPLWDIGDMTDT